MSSAACIFCKIIKGDIPSLKLFESDKVFAFLDIQPLSRGHAVRPPSYVPFPRTAEASTPSSPMSRCICDSEDNIDTWLVIPKFHGAKLTDIPDEDLLEILDTLRGYIIKKKVDLENGNIWPVAKKIAQASGATDFNILQNNGRIAHQVVDHVHFHMIPKPNEKEGMSIGWPTQETDMDKLKALHEEIKSKM
ncbi:uncharacterized protein N7483_005229 [Penicillium malachiteum]|uniref:uncharacterized protein n=1 Tax=Penicillium malachiteum TaxID=1324776 RepID=UPI002549BC47|nr:uncharacterized protein N7483_005229 [Penicillium malachiteum]KAJ5730721.1 hypothetical protein N7483_005229 [Penicillium malachiteum]